MRPIKFALLFLLITFCNNNTAAEKDINESRGKITIEKKYDCQSRTVYYLTYIPHKDDLDKILKLDMAMSISTAGETVLDFSRRMNTPLLAINASQGIPNLEPGHVQAAGIQIVDKKIIRDIPYKAYAHTLGIKDNNELLYFKPGIRAAEMFATGVNHALCGFIPLIIDHEPVGDEFLNILGGIQQPHPRQVIAQFDNLDLLILSCGGRGYDGEGMTGSDIIRVLEDEEQKVKFAFMLDGGGSVTTVINGEVITKKIDKKGTVLRPRGNFLYIQ